MENKSKFKIGDVVYLNSDKRTPLTVIETENTGRIKCAYWNSDKTQILITPNSLNQDIFTAETTKP